MYDTLYEDTATASEDLSFLKPESAAARAIVYIESNSVIGGHANVNPKAVEALLEMECKAVAEGDLSTVRRSLAAQIKVLERLCDHLLDRAMAHGPSVFNYDTYLKLAFRAQSQLNRAISLLARLSAQMMGKETKEAPTPQTPSVEKTGSERTMPPAIDLGTSARLTEIGVVLREIFPEPMAV